METKNIHKKFPHPQANRTCQQSGVKEMRESVISSSASDTPCVPCGESLSRPSGAITPVSCTPVSMYGLDNSVGIAQRAAVVGCNSNNGNASARTVNGNNTVGNGNDNYVGGLSLIDEKLFLNTGNSIRRDQQGQRLTEEVMENANSASPCREYGTDWDDIPFCTVESRTKSLHVDDENDVIRMLDTNRIREARKHYPDPIWDELEKANKKRKLTGLKKFLTHPVIVKYAVERCLTRAANSPQKKKALRKVDKIVKRIIREFTNETYSVQKCKPRVIKKRGKDGKDRNAKIFCIYDRCVQNVIFTVISPKLTNKLLRHVYSGVKNRSTLSNDRRYCLYARTLDFCCKHPNAWVGMTDIKHFYESLRSERVLEVLYETVKDRYTFSLLYNILMSTKTLPIGGTLSQICAMLVVNECDREVLKRFKPKYYAIFGDNRLFGDEDKNKLIKIKEFQDIYYHTRYGLEMKNDYQFRRVANGFRFCKTDFKPGYIKLRSEMKRRAIRAVRQGQPHYAGYKGFLMKTDSKHLRNLIENETFFVTHRYRRMSESDGEKFMDSFISKKFNMSINKETTEDSKKNCPVNKVALTAALNKVRKSPEKRENTVTGEKMAMANLVGRPISITAYQRKSSKQKDGNDYYIFQAYTPVFKNGKQSAIAIKSHNSSADIRYFFARVEEGIIQLPVKTKVCVSGNSYYFEGYRDFLNDVAGTEIEELGLTFDASDYENLEDLKFD